jgi:hypothetical protein
MEWIYIFLAGVVLDILSTMYVRAVAKKETFSAARMTFLGEFVSLTVFLTILNKLDGGAGLNVSMPYVIVYCFGSSAGTILVMSDKERIKKAVKTMTMYFF